VHVAFGARSREQVDEFWRAGSEAGYAGDRPPGPRPDHRGDAYGAVLRDPDGNRAEAVVHGERRRSGIVDHVWIRVADLAASRRFYDTIAPHARLGVGDDEPERVRFTARGASLSLAQGTPTKHVHLAFPTDDDGDVRRFHDVATSAGYRSYGPPSERPRYHPGYYAAYVLDPDGNNVEVVNHHR
jgi:predicted lactoylglutathione lyase